MLLSIITITGITDEQSCADGLGTSHRTSTWAHRQLRSSVSGTLDSQRTRTVLGRRAFRVCGPVTWNALPTELRTATVCLDTCLYESAYWESITNAHNDWLIDQLQHILFSKTDIRKPVSLQATIINN